ncbi:YbgC/FadM family acyl-CoA thioesterase [Variovorax sp.]|uniref:YbgC/FadM family acyl-CoA thioesterase n=1 Tax=Variovorax sp. TaxID=1871043 RepID=UPI002D449DA8|nr:YbgC/FadM family acyl-CoA thioesterase [Variovorax sp.]HYP86008.1 YbgC/FadM family acyl-CoA thioesterase [Variovorax sp.]
MPEDNKPATRSDARAELLRRSDFRFFHRLRVRWAEVDMQKIVFNAHYLMYFDTAIADYWRALALPYEESMHALQGDLYVRKATVEFHASARIDELIEVGMRCTRVGNSSMVFDGGLFRGDQLLVSCELVYVFADPSTQTSRPVPPLLRGLLAAYERGEPVCALRTGTWSELGEGAGALRREVFIEEQAIPAELEWDADDATAVHGVALNALGRVIATGRLLEGDSPGLARIGRMAVHRNLRGGRWGAAVLRLLEDSARARGDREVRLHAQRSAQAFYERLGYAVRGEPFEEAGIMHIEMARTL